MTRRGIAAAFTLLALLALAALIRGEKGQSPAQARSLLHWVDSRQGRIPHSGLLVTTTVLGRRAITGSVRLSCTRDGRSRIEYLSPPLKSGVVAFQEGSRVWREGTAHDAVGCPGGACGGSPSRHRRHLEILLRNYEPRILGQGHTAGRPVYRMVLVHRRSGLVARRWWVDSDTGLILRSEDHRAEGPLGVRTLYREVRFLALPSVEMPSPPAAPDGAAPIPAAQEAGFLRRLGLPRIRPRYVPVGYVCDGLFPYECSYSCGGRGAHIQFSDGLRALSIFASAHGVGNPAYDVIPLPLGAMLRMRHRGASFVFVGEVGEMELRRMAASLP